MVKNIQCIEVVYVNKEQNRFNNTYLQFSDSKPSISYTNMMSIFSIHIVWYLVDEKAWLKVH